MAELTNIAAELSKGKNIESNLSKYAAGMNSLFNRIAHVKLALNLYTFAEVYGEDDMYAEELKAYADKLAEIISEGVINDAVSDELINEIDTLRNDIIARMEILTSFVDRFQIFEYVLNRIEYKFEECDINPDYYDDKFEKDILKYIVSDKDNSVVNMKISQVVGQLPMRLSKNKFFELVKEALTLYKGSEVKSVEDFIYMLRSSAMLHTPENFENEFPKLTEWLNKLNGYSYADMEEAAFREASECFTNASDYVTGLTDMYVMMMQALNDAYTILLSAEAALTDTEEKNNCLAIIKAATEALAKKDIPGEDVFELFVGVEGIQEKLFMQLSGDGYALDDVKASLMDNTKAAKLEEIYDKLFKMNLLNSGSDFVPLNAVEESSVIADEAYIEAEGNKLINELGEIFASHERMINRAIMAGILSNLPVFFNSAEEIKEYIHVSLGQCKDEAEKKACMSVMLLLMND